MMRNKKIYNTALDLYMVYNCYRLEEILGEKVKPEWYYNSRERQFILFKLDSEQAHKIWEQIKQNIERANKYVGFLININPFCLAVNTNCDNCPRRQYCSYNLNLITEAAEQKCLEIDTILSKKWYQKCIQIITKLLELNE